MALRQALGHEDPLSLTARELMKVPGRNLFDTGASIAIVDRLVVVSSEPLVKAEARVPAHRHDLRER